MNAVLKGLLMRMNRLLPLLALCVLPATAAVAQQEPAAVPRLPPPTLSAAGGDGAGVAQITTSMRHCMSFPDAVERGACFEQIAASLGVRPGGKGEPSVLSHGAYSWSTDSGKDSNGVPYAAIALTADDVSVNGDMLASNRRATLVLRCTGNDTHLYVAVGSPLFQSLSDTVEVTYTLTGKPTDKAKWSPSSSGSSIGLWQSSQAITTAMTLMNNQTFGVNIPFTATQTLSAVFNVKDMAKAAETVRRACKW